MRNLKLLAVAGLMFCGRAQAQTTQVNLNRAWKFQLGDFQGAQATRFDDKQWSDVGLPHSFSLPYFGSTNFYVGYGWYRKYLQVPASWRGQRVALDFEGVFQDAEVFVNGQAVGRHRGGYTGFEVDITSALKTGANVIAVRVNNLWNARLAPRAGEHVFSGGIYRDVHLTVKNPLHVAWYGTAVTTPQVSKESATVKVQTEVTNQNRQARLCIVRHAVVSPDGKTVARWESRQSIAPGQSATFDQASPTIARPQLWHPDHPVLYTVRTTVLDGRRVVDETSSKLGFRWFKWTADQGFFLNGERLYLYGANVHQDHAGWGDAVTNAGFERDVKMVKDAGFNMIRGSHYPHDPAFAEACDRLGILLWSENAFWGIGGFRPDGYWNCSAYPPSEADQPEFEASVRQQLREMIRVLRNHPSIIAWSMSNEPFFSAGAVIPKMKAFLGEMVAYSHQLDPTRPAAIGGAQRPLDENRIDTVGDIAGYNGDGATVPLFQNPGVANLVSEYGSTTAIRPGEYKPGWDQLARGDGKPVHPWRSGQAIWCMFDHGSIAGDNLGRMGIVDYFRIPKRAWYWYRNEYRQVPPPVWPQQGTPAKLRLQTSASTLQGADGTQDARISITVLDAQGRDLSNVVPVTLEVVSGPGEFPTGRSITFAPGSDIAILDGQAAIEFRSYHAGRSMLRATSPGLQPAEISIVSNGAPRWIEGVTQPVKPRPYTRYTQQPSTTQNAAAADVNIASQRPTKASSSAPDTTSASVTDGKESTFWQAARADAAPWIQVDLENTYTVRRVQLAFREEANYRYKIQVSTNGTDWQTVADESQTTSSNKTRVVTGDLGRAVRALRVAFSGQPEGKAVAITEITVGGNTP